MKRPRRIFSIGLPRCEAGGERRFPLTPEAVAIMVERGFEVRVEEGAGNPIHYSDAAYTRCGASVVSRSEA